MASFESFKDKALSYLAVTMIAGIGYQLNVLNQKVDKLMEVSAGTVVRIEGLEREVYKASYNAPVPPSKLPKQIRMMEVVAIRPEQDYKVKKYITTI